MREIPHVLGNECVSAGLDGSEVCRLGIFAHGDRGCFSSRGRFFGALGDLFQVLGVCHTTRKRRIDDIGLRKVSLVHIVDGVGALGDLFQHARHLWV